MSQVALGNNITQWFNYNNRLQVAAVQAAVAANPSAYLFAQQPNWGTTSNNGNLQGETIWKGGPGPLAGRQHGAARESALRRLLGKADYRRPKSWSCIETLIQKDVAIPKGAGGPFSFNVSWAGTEPDGLRKALKEQLSLEMTPIAREPNVLIAEPIDR